MKPAEKHKAIAVIKAMMKQRLKEKGIIKNVSEDWLNREAEKFFNKHPEGVQILEGQDGVEL